MGGDPFEQSETDLLEFFRVARLQAFGLKVLYASNQPFRSSILLRSQIQTGITGRQ